MKVVSLFSGIGGFEEGIKRTSIPYEIVLASEIDIHARKSYLANFPDTPLFSDVTKIPTSSIPDHDILVAGFPCQPFSIAGEMKGFLDTRGTLFFEVVRFLEAKHPKYILLENVKNLTSHDSGRTFKTIIQALNLLGYTLDFSIINSCESGVPQSRERIYIVGVLNKKPSYYDLKDTRSKRMDRIKKEMSYQGFDFFSSLYLQFLESRQKYLIDVLEPTPQERYIITNPAIKEFLARERIEENKIRTPKLINLFDLPRECLKDHKRQRRIYSPYGLSPTVLARADSPKVYMDTKPHSYIRKLSPRECGRCQGFSEDFIDNVLSTVSVTQAYKQFGNAVCPPVIEKIFGHLYFNFCEY